VDGLRPAPRHLLPPDLGHHPLHLVDGEAPQGDALEAGGAAQLGEHTRQRMTAVDLHVAVGAGDQQSCALEGAAHVHQQVQRAAVGPVQVLQNEEHGLLRGHVA